MASNNDYYFFINATMNKYVIIEISMNNNKINEYLDYIQIYEYSERYNIDFLKEEKTNIIMKESGNNTFSVNTYKVISNFTNTVCVKINPKIDTIFNIQINVTDYK